jgi:hypothetical protein
MGWWTTASTAGRLEAQTGFPGTGETAADFWRRNVENRK